MHIVDIAIVCAAVLVVVVLAAVLARQRYMLSVGGGVPVGVRVRGSRWTYGIGRFVGGELRWYSAIGVGTRPSRVLDRTRLSIVTHRRPAENELSSLPANAVVVECRVGDATMTLAFSESAFTGFVSWLEASAPRS